MTCCRLLGCAGIGNFYKLLMLLPDVGDMFSGLLGGFGDHAASRNFRDASCCGRNTGPTTLIVAVHCLLMAMAAVCSGGPWRCREGLDLGEHGELEMGVVAALKWTHGHGLLSPLLAMRNALFDAAVARLTAFCHRAGSS
ncbi:hypothetical protein ACLOJK_034388 [Asimina triloba]